MHSYNPYFMETFLCQYLQQLRYKQEKLRIADSCFFTHFLGIYFWNLYKKLKACTCNPTYTRLKHNMMTTNRYLKWHQSWVLSWKNFAILWQLLPLIPMSFSDDPLGFTDQSGSVQCTQYNKQTHIWGDFLSHNILLLQSDKNGIFNPPGRVLNEIWLT